jgi:hypothetical protein
MIARIELSSPPGVSIRRITTGARLRAASAIPRVTKSAVAGPIAPSRWRICAAGLGAGGEAETSSSASSAVATILIRCQAAFSPGAMIAMRIRVFLQRSIA